MLRKLFGGLALVCLTTGVLYARQGIITTTDHRTIEGDITPQGDSVQVIVKGQPRPLIISKNAIEKTVYPDEVGAQVRDALKQLGPTDVRSRVLAAREAINAHAYDAAREALNQAAAIDPKNREVRDLLDQVARLAPAPEAPAPASQPTTAPASPATPPKPSVQSFTYKRQVTPAEINRIRQLEWRADQQEAVRVQIEPEARRKFLAGYVDISPPDFNALSPQSQAALILDKGRPEVKTGVLITSDPATMVEFKKSVNRVILQSCASVACHGSAKTGPFVLVNPAANNAAVYTNFLILQDSWQEVKGAKRPLIDRNYPETSLLVQYLLPADLADTPHPEVPNYRGAVRTKNDPRYTAILNWIQSLNPVAPPYNIDLAQEGPATAPKSK